jgi:enoyl-CoA hydratase
MPEGTTLVQYIVDERIAVLTIANPPVNALSRQALAGLEAAFAAADSDPEVKAIIITGAGTCFVAGADIRELAQLDVDTAREFARHGQALFDRIARSTRPVIAAINGRACLGGGNELALACHIRLAEESVRLGQPEVKLGIMPGWGGTLRLPRCVGPGKALELILSGEAIAAREALRIGLVDQVVPAGSALTAARDLARQLAQRSALGLAACLRVAQHAWLSIPAEALQQEAEEFARLFASEDHREGLRAFLEKRAPEFCDC